MSTCNKCIEQQGVSRLGIACLIVLSIQGSNSLPTSDTGVSRIIEPFQAGKRLLTG